MSALALQLIAENKRTKATTLDLGNCGLTEVPEEVGDCVWLKRLNLEKNQITKIPDCIINLVNVKDLKFGYNQLTSIDILINLPKLRRVLFSNNQLQDVSVLGQLTDLQGIDLRSNAIHNIDFVSKLNKLIILYLTNNSIEIIDAISELKNLQTLFLTNNKVIDLRPLKGLDKLRKLDISKNFIVDLLPIKMLISDNLPVFYKFGYGTGKGIFVDDNPWSNPPPAIIKQGNAAILNYFAEREKQQFKNQEIKLILVGNSTAGKTSLSQFLRDRNYQPNQSSTHGILPTQWLPTGHDLQVNIWDFGGQEYYHATHRLFLSRNAVYVLVWDAQTDKGGYSETNVYFDDDPEPSTLQLEHFPQKWWLKNIRHYTRESNPPVPILLVQNKCARDGVQRVSSEFEKPPFALKAEWLDHHIDLESTAAHLADPKPETRRWARSFEDFEERLLHRLEHQLAKFEFAIYHREIRDRVRQLAAEGKNAMLYSDFEELCRGIEADAKMDLVQIYLRDVTGDILYYPKNQRLQKRVFLRPVWVCDCIYQVLSRQVQTQDGLFGINWVQNALQCNENEALDFVELMREFELVFAEFNENGQSTGQLVAPQYLPATCTKPDKLEGAKEFANLSHAFTLWFPDFLPKSHVARFVARWGSQAEQRLFWKNGLLFKTQGCTALVERTEEGKIRVDIQANQPKRVEAVRHVFQSFMQLEDGQPSFAVSLDASNFVWWRDAQEAMYSQAKQVKTLAHTETSKYVELSPFFIFQPPIMAQPKKVFISYSHRDEDAMKELNKFLGPLERKGDITIWTDRKILPGQN